MECQLDLTIMIDRSNMKMYPNILFIPSIFVRSEEFYERKKLDPQEMY